jgi:hypothetical protein
MYPKTSDRSIKPSLSPGTLEYNICTRIPCQGTYLRNRIHIDRIKDLGGAQG